MVSISFELTKKDHYQKEWMYSLKSWPIFLVSSIVIVPMSFCLSFFIINLILTKEAFLEHGLFFFLLGSLIFPAILFLITLAIIEKRAKAFGNHGRIAMDFSSEAVRIKSNLVVQIIPKRAFETDNSFGNFEIY